MSDDFLWDLLSTEPNTVPSPPADTPVAARPAVALIAWRPAHIVCALLFGVCFDGVMRADRFGIGASLAITASGVGVCAVAGERRRERIVAAGAAVLLGWFLYVRSSAWLSWPTFLTSCLMLCLAATPRGIHRVGRLRDVLRRTVRVLRGPADLLVDVLQRLRPRLGAARGPVKSSWIVVRGLLFAVPVVVLLGSLLASGDALFADSLSVKTPSIGPGLGHLFLFAVGLVTVGSLFAASFMESSDVEPGDDRVRIGVVETTMVLGSVAVLYLFFGGVQLFAVLAGSEHVMKTTGLTYAEYARSGFFQLLAVSLLTLVVLGLARFASGTTARTTRPVTLASLAVVVLTIGIVGVAFRRMSLYEHAYGFTMRRLLPHVVIAVLGVVFALLAAAYALDVRRALRGSRETAVDGDPARSGAHQWLLPVVGAVCLAAVVGVNVVNLEAVVARSQLNRATEQGDGGGTSGRVFSAGVGSGIDEIFGLGTDAVPVVAAWLAERRTDASPQVASVTTWLCAKTAPSNWAGASLSWSRASGSRNVCRTVEDPATRR